ISTPRVLLDRFLTCPSEASTEKPFPRYFWMVFALAGDSTMTKPFDNGTSVFLCMFFEASTNRRKATSYGIEAVSYQLLHERRPHTFHFHSLLGNTPVISCFEQLQVAR